ncbi:MAG: C1 family peptidase, partial [Corynebacterium variabile]
MSENMNGINTDTLAGFAADLASDASWKVARNAATVADVQKLTLDREILASADHSMSVKLDQWAVADQQRSGRCWLFAGLNSVRGDAMDETGIKDLEYSQSWLHYWDKLEKAN